MKYIVINALLVGTLTLSGCATIVSGKHDSIYVQSKPEGAACLLENDKSRIRVVTPAAAKVRRSKAPLRVSCTKYGYRGRTVLVNAKLNGAAAGNIIMPGGLIGAGVDAANGAAFNYPSKINIKLSR